MQRHSLKDTPLSTIVNTTNLPQTVKIINPPQFPDIQLVVTVFSHCCNSRTDSGEAKARAMRPPRHNAAKHCFLTHFSLNPEANRTNVSEETPYRWRPKLTCRRPAQEIPNAPLTRTTLGQLWTASWVSRSQPAVTQDGIKPGYVVTPQALMLCLRPLRHSGIPSKPGFNTQILLYGL